jgi:hypothetical protein
MGLATGSRVSVLALPLALALTLAGALTGCGGTSDPAQESTSPSATPSPSVTGKSTPGMTLDEAVAAAEAETCSGCVTPTQDPAEAEESARRGLVELSVSASDGAYVGLWAYSGQAWQVLAGYQNDVPMPNRLPSDIWICTDTSATDVRAGPGEDYPVVATVDAVTPVRATFMRLTQPQSTTSDGSPVNGTGWFEVSWDDSSGWVSSTRVDRLDACSVWP